MFLVGILSWWYGDGWRQRFWTMRERIARMSDYFSLGLLLKSLFSPFRQISAGNTNGPLGVVFRAFIDQMISRFIGMFVRLFTIIFGIMVIILISLWGCVVLFGWLIIPIFPVIGLIATVLGWVPSWQ